MKAVKIVIGGLAGLYALAQCVQLVLLLTRQSHPSALLGSVSGICIGGALCIWLLKSAFAGER